MQMDVMALDQGFGMFSSFQHWSIVMSCTNYRQCGRRFVAHSVGDVWRESQGLAARCCGCDVEEDVGLARRPESSATSEHSCCDFRLPRRAWLSPHQGEQHCLFYNVKLDFEETILDPTKSRR